jgi:nucleoid-associated protein YgaU
MSKIKCIGFLVSLLLIVAILIPSGSSVAADKMTYEQYQIELSQYQERETKALDAIKAEQAAIAEMQAKIAETKTQIASLWDEMYAMMGVNKADVDAFLAEITRLENRVKELAALSPAQLLDNADELDELADHVMEMQGNVIALLSEPRNRLNRIATRIDALKNSLPKPKHDMYSVVRGDHLWKISGKQQIFADPWKWMRIYSANREDIKNPDLIYPDQRLRIPRQIGRDEHLVVRGEFLKKIAGYAQVYNDPFQWTKIYQANKSIIQDPNLIYPEQILIVPRN